MRLSRLTLIWLCLALVLVPVFSRAQTSADVTTQRLRLQAELEQEEAAIAVQTKLLQAKQNDVHTVAGEVNLLKSQIAQAQADIKAKKVAILNLQSDITVRVGTIKQLDDRIAQGQVSIGEMLRQVRDADSLSFIEIALAGDDLSTVFRNVDDFTSVQERLHEAFAAMRGTQEQAKQEKTVLEQKKDATVDAQAAIETQKAIIQKREDDKKVVLAINQQQANAYQTVLAQRQKHAAEIRAALFGLRDTAAIPFGQALDYANAASKKTGVRPAFLLAILTQESNLGENVGSCYLADATTGSGTSVKSGRPVAKVMKPSRDIPPFLSIMKDLGGNPYNTLVSCPQATGWGGAMGPAQFIPSTWVLFADRIASALGITLPDPWRPPDAFMASALYLSDLGGVNGSYSGEIRAACKYYGSGGSTCTYGKQVMSHASDIQLNMIDPLQNS